MKRRPTEYESLEALAGQYRRAGYDVVIRPERDQLPAVLRRFQPDMIARREDDNVVFEMKSRAELVTDNQLAQFAEYVAKLKGWRFEVQVIEQPKEHLQRPAAPLSVEEALRRLSSATLLLKANDGESALVVAWSAFEAVLRQLSWQADIVISPWNGRRAAKELVMRGAITRSDYDLFMRGLEARNHVVHGGATARPVKPLVRSVISAVRRVASEFAKISSKQAG
jgi:hypothetical protein